MTILQVTPYLCVSDAAAAIAFYEKAFGAVESFRLTDPGGRVGHAELAIGPMTLMLGDECPDAGIGSASAFGGTAVTLQLQVDDTDAAITAAVAAGAAVERPAQDQFYGWRSGAVRDPFDHRWLIGHAMEPVDPQERQRRYTRLLSG